MANFNKVVLVGNLTRDPQLRYLPSQMAVCDFGLAINHRFKTKTGEEREEVCFVDCSAFGKQAEVINQYCQKGKQLLVEGRLKYDTWEDKQGGGKRSKHSVVIDNFQFLGGPREGGGGGGGGGGQSSGDESDQRPRSAPPPRRPQAQAPAQPPISEEEHFKEDDIPF
jgi:single-strand DNA-binding protein